jgi:hypothetical protein
MRVTIDVQPAPQNMAPFVPLAESPQTNVPALLDATFTWATDDGKVTGRVGIAVEVVDGYPVCTRIEVRGSIDEPITKQSLGGLDVAWMVNRAVEAWGFTAVDGKPGTWSPDSAGVREALDALPRRRRHTSPERLQNVASAYRRGKVQAVQDELHVSEPQAYRLIAKARAANYLEERAK